jgi:hypothetical protein
MSRATTRAVITGSVTFAGRPLCGTRRLDPGLDDFRLTWPRRPSGHRLGSRSGSDRETTLAAGPRRPRCPDEASWLGWTSGSRTAGTPCAAGRAPATSTALTSSRSASPARASDFVIAIVSAFGTSRSTSVVASMSFQARRISVVSGPDRRTNARKQLECRGALVGGERRKQTSVSPRNSGQSSSATICRRSYSVTTDISSGAMSIIASISGPPVRLNRQTRTAARPRKTTLRIVV